MSPPPCSPPAHTRCDGGGAAASPPPRHLPPGRTPPPGFANSDTQSGGTAVRGGSPPSTVGASVAPAASPAPQQQAYYAAAHAAERGAVLRADGGTFSAPPPPGFGATPDQRSGSARLDLIRGLLSSGGGGGDGTTQFTARHRQPVSSHQKRKQKAALLHPAAITGADRGRGNDSACVGSVGLPYDDDDNDHQKRTISFANLAAALGEGLAESMESSLQRQRSDRLQEQSSSLAQASSASVFQQAVGMGTSLSTVTAQSSSVADRCLDTVSRKSRHSTDRFVGTSAAHGVGDGAEVRFSSTPAATVIPSRMLPCRDESTASSTEIDSAPSPSVLSSLQSSRSTPLSLYPQPSLVPSPRIHGMSARGATVEEPQSDATSPPVPTSVMHGLSLKHSEVKVRSISSAGFPNHAVATETSGGGTCQRPGLSSLASRNFPGSVPHQTGTKGANRDVLHSKAVSFPSPNSPPHTRMDKNSISDGLDSSVMSLPHEGGGQPIHQVDLKQIAEQELSPFLWDPSSSSRRSSESSSTSSQLTPSPSHQTSRGLVILGASGLHVPDVRSTCEAFGALLNFRHEFGESRGVIFLAYHDLRSARYAMAELTTCLEKLATPQGESRSRGASRVRVKVQYCVPLNSSSANDESMIVLGNVPPDVGDQNLTHIMKLYGAVRSVRMDSKDTAGASYVVEFYDIQDARQALLELESSHPWGSGVSVTVGMRHPVERGQGQDLLTLLGRWRRGEQATSAPAEPNCSLPVVRSPSSGLSATVPPEGSSPSSSSDSTSPMPEVPDPFVHSGLAVAPTSAGNQLHDPPVPATGVHLPVGAPQHPPTTQLMVGPDGQYTYFVVNPTTLPQQFHPPPTYMQQQHVIHGPHGTYVTSVPTGVPIHHHPAAHHQYVVHHHPGPHHLQAHVPQYHHLAPSTLISAHHYVDGGHHSHAVPVYASVAPPNHHTNSSVSCGGSGQPFVMGSGDARRTGGHTRADAALRSSGEESTQLGMNIDAVKDGRDARTSLMVRNIPNKYTQRMLLNEFAEGGHGSDKIDFFYLPIDFKNKCNRGYAFVNFVDYRDIVSFHHHYNGKGWKVFNSDKICDITYARIQGKAAMMKRFQNSALMEKDEEYKPLVFVSHGEDKGKREDFPPAQSAANENLYSPHR